MDRPEPSSGYALSLMRSTLVIAAVLALSLSACGAATSTQNDKFKGAQQDVVKVVDALAPGRHAAATPTRSAPRSWPSSS